MKPGLLPLASMAGAVALALSGCAALVNGPASEVTIATNPAGAQCSLSGVDGFSASLTSPASLRLPHKAAPVTVSCQAPGYRRTVNTLNAGASGWLWGNAALVVFTGGGAALGLMVDEAIGATTTYGPAFSMDLDPEIKRHLRIRLRDGSREFDAISP